jgi:hypothetical protein
MCQDLQNQQEVKIFIGEDIFNSIEQEKFENIFLMSDNNLFFKMNKDEESTKNYIKD